VPARAALPGPAMPDPLPHLSHAARRGLQLVLACCILLPLLLLVLWGERSWRMELSRAGDQAMRNAELVREYALGVVNTQMAVLDHVASLVGAAGPEEAGQAELDRRLAALDQRMDSVLRLGVIDADGVLVAASTHPARPVDLSDREYFRSLRDGTARLGIERVTLRPGGQDAIVLAMRRPGDGFAGVVTSVVPVQAFTDFLGRIAADPRVTASLIRADGTLLVRRSPTSPPARLGPGTAARRAMAQGDRGLYQARSLTDGMTRIYGFARVGDLPIYVNFGIARGAVVEAWLGGMAVVGALLLSAGLGCYAAVLQISRRMQAAVDRELLAEARRRADLQEALLRELHHRVKNSLMTVQSLIRMQPGVDPQAAATLQRRVIALAQVHDLLHVADMSSRLELSGFLRALCANPAIVPPQLDVALECQVEPLEVGVEQAGPLALVVVELLANALRHAFPATRPGRVTVRLGSRGPHGLLSVRDDGIGMPGEGERGRHSGLALVERLIAQLHGSLEIRSEAGTEVTVTFPRDG
jgi:two-component sensor histidine kinase